MDNIIDDIIFEPDDELQEFIADNPVTHALLTHLIDELEGIHDQIPDWNVITDIVLAAAAFSFFKSGGTSNDFLQKLKTVDIQPDISKLN